MPVQQLSSATDRLTTNLSLLLSNSTTKITFWLPAIFFVLALFGILHHEPWRDELQPWLIARDSSTIWELQSNLRYERHPILWYLCLFCLTRFTHDPFAMQLMHVLIATGCVFLVCRFAPFGTAQKVFFSFGYYSFFEYCLISRSYALGALLLFSVCATFSFQKMQFYFCTQTILLCLLTQTSVFGVVLALALASGLVLDSFIHKKGQPILNRRRAIGMLLAVAIAASFSVIQILSDSGDQKKFDDASKAAAMRICHTPKFALATLYGYLPLPLPKHDFWNSSCYSAPQLLPLTVVSSLVLFGVVCVSLLDSPAALIVFISGNIAIAAIMSGFDALSARYAGHSFLLLITCLWISHYCKRLNSTENLNAPEKGRPLVDKLFLFLLAVQFLVGISCFCADCFLPFSNSRALASFIKNQQLEDLSIVVCPDPVGIGLASLLKTKVYQLRSGKKGSFDFRGPKLPPLKTDETIIKRLEHYSLNQPTDFLLVRARPFRASSFSDVLKWSLLQSYTMSIADQRERYYLYKVERRLSPL